jgi:tetratricopeptide (TPR) repeat protein
MRADSLFRGVVLASWMAAGCLLPRPPGTPSPDAPKWIELSSTHFTMSTDLAGDEATLVLSTFELAYVLLSKAVFGGTPPPELATHIINFRSQVERREFLPEATGRYIRQLPTDLQPVPTVVTAGELSQETRVTFVHELAHRFQAHAFGSMPPWLSEGLAVFYSTVRGDPLHPDVGAIDPETTFASGNVWSDPGHIIFQGVAYLPSELPSASELIGFQASDFYRYGPKYANEAPSVRGRAVATHYAAASALVHMLMTTTTANARRFAEVLRRAARVHNASLALERIALDRGALDRELAAYVMQPLPWHPKWEAPPPELSGIRQRELGKAQVLVLWARLVAVTSTRGRRYMQEAIAASPRDREVQFWSGVLQAWDDRLEDAERLQKAALAQDPDNAGYAMALAKLYRTRKHRKPTPNMPTDGEVAELMNHLVQIAHTGTELATVATYYLDENRPTVARPFAERACQVEPDCWICLHTYACVIFRSGNAAEAATIEQSALALLPEPPPPGAEETLKPALRFFEEEAKKSGAASTRPPTGLEPSDPEPGE